MFTISAELHKLSAYKIRFTPTEHSLGLVATTLKMSSTHNMDVLTVLSAVILMQLVPVGTASYRKAVSGAFNRHRHPQVASYHHQLVRTVHRLLQILTTMFRLSNRRKRLLVPPPRRTLRSCVFMPQDVFRIRTVSLELDASTSEAILSVFKMRNIPIEQLLEIIASILKTYYMLNGVA